MRSIGYFALGLLSLLIVASLIDRISPYPLGKSLGGREDGTSLVIAHKLRYFEQHKDAYDVLFFGSSRLFAGVVPSRFDAELAARGRPLRSFNFAMNAMMPHETDALIRRVLAMEPRRLRWAVIELNYWTGNLGRALVMRPRTIFWHDLPNTLAAMRSSVLYTRKSRYQKAEMVVGHLLHFGAHATALGRGPQAFRSLRASRDAMPGFPRWLVADQGYQQPGWGRKALLEHLDEYEKKLERLKKNRDRVAGNLEKYNVRAITEQQAGLRRAGVTPLHVIPPNLDQAPLLRLLAERGIVESLLAFNDPVVYPELYLVDHRWDPDHLTTRGAEILSTLLAEQFSARFAGPEGEPRAVRPLAESG